MSATVVIAGHKFDMKVVDRINVPGRVESEFALIPGEGEIHVQGNADQSLLASRAARAAIAMSDLCTQEVTQEIDQNIEPLSLNGFGGVPLLPNDPTTDDQD